MKLELNKEQIQDIALLIMQKVNQLKQIRRRNNESKSHTKTKTILQHRHHS